MRELRLKGQSCVESKNWFFLYSASLRRCFSSQLNAIKMFNFSSFSWRAIARWQQDDDDELKEKFISGVKRAVTYRRTWSKILWPIWYLNFHGFCVWLLKKYVHVHETAYWKCIKWNLDLSSFILWQCFFFFIIFFGRNKVQVRRQVGHYHFKENWQWNFDHRCNKKNQACKITTTWHCATSIKELNHKSAEMHQSQLDTLSFDCSSATIFSFDFPQSRLLRNIE